MEGSPSHPQSQLRVYAGMQEREESGRAADSQTLQKRFVRAPNSSAALLRGSTRGKLKSSAKTRRLLVSPSEVNEHALNLFGDVWDRILVSLKLFSHPRRTVHSFGSGDTDSIGFESVLSAKKRPGLTR